jgi:hypothetical protein
MEPMTTFDPSRRCEAHDQLNDSWDPWDPVTDEALYRAWAEPQHSQSSHVMQYDGRLLGWRELARELRTRTGCIGAG